MDGNKIVIILDILAFLLLISGIVLIVLAKKKQKREHGRKHVPQYLSHDSRYFIFEPQNALPARQ